MAIKVKIGAVKVGKEYIGAGKTISGLSKEEEALLVSNGTADYVPEQQEAEPAAGEAPKDPENGDAVSEKGKAK